MRESTLESADLPMPTWDTLEGWARSSIQSLLQQVLERRRLAGGCKRWAVAGVRGGRA